MTLTRAEVIQGRPVSEHKLLWQPSDCIINFVLLTLLLHVGNKYDDDDDDDDTFLRQWKSCVLLYIGC